MPGILIEFRRQYTKEEEIDLIEAVHKALFLYLHLISNHA